MRRIKLNGKMMTSIEETHEYLQEVLHLPDYYGKNLDALWDILSYTSIPTEIIIINPTCMYKNLGQYGYDLAEVFNELDAEGGNIKVIFEY